MSDMQFYRIEHDDDDDEEDKDDDDEIIIIENPNPKLKPPLIVLCESDEEEDQGRKGESKDVITLDDSLVSPDVIDVLSEDDDLLNESSVNNPIWINKTSSSSCTQRAASNIDPLPDYIPLDTDSSSHILASNELNKKYELMRNWYEKFKMNNVGLSSLKSSYTCPECRAELSTVKMLDRHVQFRHPSSIHRYRLDSSTAELWDKSHSNETVLSQKRLKLSPLLKSPISSGSTTCSSTNISNTSSSTITLTKNHEEPSKIAVLPPLVYRRTGINQDDQNSTSSSSGSTACSSTNISNTSICTLTNNYKETGIHQEDKAMTPTAITSGKSNTTDGNNKMCQPLTVVIYSPNSQRDRNNRYVQISPLSTDRQNKADKNKQSKQSEIIELFDSPCRHPTAVTTVDEVIRNESRSFCNSGPPPRKRKRKDALEDDNNEQEKSRKPAKNKEKGKGKASEKTFSCRRHGKTFATRKALSQHKKDKHYNNTSASNLTKGKRKYCLRPRNNSKTSPLPSSSSPPSMDKLKTMKHIILIDIDNWQKIFQSDLTFSPSTFVWGFHGGSTYWKPPVSSSLLNNLQRMNCFYLHPKCGKSKDAADFALCVQAGKLDVLLPKDIIFTVLSGDQGFNELQNQLSLSKREVHIVNPHYKTIDTVLTILNSIAER